MSHPEAPGRVYIAGPMTGMPDLNFPTFKRVANAMRARGYEVVNPVDINSDQSADWVACMRADIKALVDCSSIVMLPGWEKSRGATLEHVVAQQLGMHVRFAQDVCPEAFWMTPA